MDSHQTRSRSDLLARPARALAHFSPAGSACIWKAARRITLEKAYRVARSQSTRQGTRRLWRHKTLLWVTWRFTELPAAKPISTEWPASGLRCAILVRWRWLRVWAITAANT